jgi:hypothetical protein
VARLGRVGSNPTPGAYVYVSAFRFLAFLPTNTNGFLSVKVKLFVVHEAYCLRLRNVYLFIVVFFKRILGDEARL